MAIQARSPGIAAQARSPTIVAMDQKDQFCEWTMAIGEWKDIPPRAARQTPFVRFIPPFAGLVALAECPDPIPSRTRPSNAPAPMVLCLKTWESRSSPGLQSAELSSTQCKIKTAAVHWPPFAFLAHGDYMRRTVDAGWSSPVARQAHNLKVTGSNPVPATKFLNDINALRPA